MVGSDRVDNPYIRDLIDYDGILDYRSEERRKRAKKHLTKSEPGWKHRENFVQLLNIIYMKDYHNRKHTDSDVRSVFNFYTRKLTARGDEGFTTSDGKSYAKLQNIKINHYYSWSGEDQQRFANWIAESPLNRIRTI